MIYDLYPKTAGANSDCAYLMIDMVNAEDFVDGRCQPKYTIFKTRDPLTRIYNLRNCNVFLAVAYLLAIGKIDYLEARIEGKDINTEKIYNMETRRILYAFPIK